MTDWLKRLTASDERLNQLAGLTGLGWTGSVLGYLVTVSGYGNTLAQLVVDPRVLLYLACALFVATLGLDRLQSQVTNEEQSATHD